MDFNSVISHGFEYFASIYSTEATQIKTSDLPHVAFFGASNAGKSGLISNLCRVKNLAFSSKTPGKTKEILLFTPKHPFFHKKAFFTDFPGYGYAKVQNAIAKQWEAIPDFINKTNIVKSYILIPAEKPISQNDIDLIKILNNKQFAIVITKCDKLKPKEIEYKQTETANFFANFPSFTGQVFTVSIKKMGMENLQISKEIFDIFKLYLNKA